MCLIRQLTKKLLIITSSLLCGMTFCIAQSTYATPPGTPNFFYNNIIQHPYCAGCTDQDDNDPIECDGWMAGGQQNISGMGTLYLWTVRKETGHCGGCVEYLVDTTPTLWFNLVDDDGEGEEVWCELEIDSNQQFTSPILRYRSRKLEINSEGSIDWEFTVGQEPQCEDTNCGYYDAGDGSTTLHKYGSAIDYYWRIRACDELDPVTNLCNADNSSLWLCSGGGDCGVDGEDDDTDPWNNAKAFGYAKYFINPDDAEDSYETVGAVTSTSAQVVVVTPYELDSFSIEYGTSTSYGNETIPQTHVTGVIKTDITGLSPDELYHYRIKWTENGMTLNGKDRTFRTARSKGNTFNFAITSDVHWVKDGDYYDKMAGTLKPVLESVDADFWIDLGDFIEADIGVFWTQDHANALYARALWGINTIAHSLPFIPVVGNHEMINQYYGTDGCPCKLDAIASIRCQDVTGNHFGQPLFEYQGNARTAFFPLYNHEIETVLDPDYKTFFSWEWGDALFIVLDPYLYTTEYPSQCDGEKPVFTLGEVQRNWLLDLIDNNTHNWIFIFIHQHGGQLPGTQYIYTPGRQIKECYGRGGAATVTYSVQCDEWIRKVIGCKNVIIFLGHDHVFSTGVYEGLRFFSCPRPDNQESWTLDEIGYRGEDWIYDDREKTFSATIESVDIKEGKIYVSDYTPPPRTSDIYKLFTQLSIRNYGHEGSKKRFQREIKKADLANPSISFDNGFVATGNTGYFYVVKDGEGSLNHQLSTWERGDRIYVHRAAGGVVSVEVEPHKVVINMLDMKGNQVVYPDLYDNAGREVKFTVNISDPDNDGIPDCSDNCPYVSNPNQDDGDGDEVGDVCDNCPLESNPDQIDTDSDCIGNVCDEFPTSYDPRQPDFDSDRTGDACDNCPNISNDDQGDSDKDGLGNVCDVCPYDAQNDIDRDGVCSNVDNCPLRPNGLDLGTCIFMNMGNPCSSNDACGAGGVCIMTQEDRDDDGIGDVCDGCIDRDKDGYGSPGFPSTRCPVDNCPDVPNPGQEDSDRDKVGNACDDDNDGDGIPDRNDNCPYVLNPTQEDTYPPGGNGCGDACDCIGNLDRDEKVDARDTSIFNQHFRRKDCTQQNPCSGDFDCDGDVDDDDYLILKENIGRMGCAACEFICSYE
jgi:hypothetical protein